MEFLPRLSLGAYWQQRRAALSQRRCVCSRKMLLFQDFDFAPARIYNELSGSPAVPERVRYRRGNALRRVRDTIAIAVGCSGRR